MINLSSRTTRWSGRLEGPGHFHATRDHRVAMVAALVVVGPVAVVAGLVVAAVPGRLVVVVVGVPWGLGPQRHQASHRGEVSGIVIGPWILTT